MGFLFKAGLIIAVVAIIGGFLINGIPTFKQRVVEIINPAAKEKRILGELTTNLNNLAQSLDQASSSKSTADIESKIKNSKDLLNSSKQLLNQVSDINNNSGIIKSTVGQIINLVSDKTPYPADHLSPSPAAAVICKP